jgi:hypothetical protein
MLSIKICCHLKIIECLKDLKTEFFLTQLQLGNFRTYFFEMMNLGKFEYFLTHEGWHAGKERENVLLVLG